MNEKHTTCLNPSCKEKFKVFEGDENKWWGKYCSKSCHFEHKGEKSFNYFITACFVVALCGIVLLLLPASSVKAVALQDSVCSKYVCKTKANACGKVVVVESASAYFKGDVLEYTTNDKSICK